MTVYMAEVINSITLQVDSRFALMMKSWQSLYSSIALGML
jgi:hypothetical protein